MKNDYYLQMEKTITEILAENKKPSLLLHACCGPCSSAVLELLSNVFKISIYYYNPNIYPEEEFKRRRDELKKFTQKFPAAANINIIEPEYIPEEFYEASGVRKKPELEKEKEMGERCFNCYKLRLEKTFAYALQNGYDYLTTTLSISPYKDAKKINSIGIDLENRFNGKVKFLHSDFKKKNGFLRSLELSSEYGMYRQDYCGCIFSRRNNERI
jgi:predicted adenine nucleotide alpha hydrolase (AANH) superfamily ATPase